MTDRRVLIRAIGIDDVMPMPGVRTLRKDDEQLLGTLLYAAYKGTVDDEGESLNDALQEAQRTLRGEYGPVMWNVSFLLVSGDTAVGASVVTMWGDDDTPFLAFSAVHPKRQREGIATHLLRLSLAGLRKIGYQRLRLMVTAANTPAVRFYEKMGFMDDEDFRRK